MNYSRKVFISIIFEELSVVNSHTLKHSLTAAGILLLNGDKKRKVLETNDK
jgi:hypothetical protein